MACSSYRWSKYNFFLRWSMQSFLSKTRRKDAAQRRNESNETSAEAKLLFRRVMLVSHEPALQVFAKITIELTRARCPIDIPSNDMKKVEKKNALRIAKIQTSPHPFNVTKLYNRVKIQCHWSKLDVNNLIKSESRIITIIYKSQTLFASSNDYFL